MSAETRALSPDWHRRRIAWRIECMSIKDMSFESYGLSGNMPLEQDIIDDPGIKTLYSHHRSASPGVSRVPLPKVNPLGLTRGWTRPYFDD